MKAYKRSIAIVLLGIFSLSYLPGLAFCGFYVAKADTELFNNKSEVVLVRKDNRTVVTMSNDFQGEVKDFAMVVPVPVVLKKEDIRVVNPALFDKLDEYSGPRLVEYFDGPPCGPTLYYEEMVEEEAGTSMAPRLLSKMNEAVDLGVTIEAEYEVGEYDILILSAKESDGLRQWLVMNDYKIPKTAEDVLKPYIKSQMKFFVVKVNLQRNFARQAEYLSPIQIEFESDRFMLPIRLGMANSRGTQDMIVYALSDQGRVECTNYRTVKIPTDRNIPTFVEDNFGQFYKDLFDNSYERENKRVVFLEYAWDVSATTPVKCDPCNGPPPVNQDLLQAGCDWILQDRQSRVFFTRLHVRYSRDEFPQDLFFQVTPNREQFQGRYVMRHPPTGTDFSCNDGQDYLRDLERRRKLEVDELAALTGKNAKFVNSYIYEFSNQIRGDKGDNNVVVIPHSGNPFIEHPWALLMMAAMCLVTAVYLGFKLEKRSHSPSLDWKF